MNVFEIDLPHGTSVNIDKLANERLGKPSTGPCFFCHPQHEAVALKELLNGPLRGYNKHRLNYRSGAASLSEMWWQCVEVIYRRLRSYQQFQEYPGIPRYILIERQTWLSSFFAVALGCDVPIVETLLLHWPALRIAKRDIHDHLRVHTVYTFDHAQSWPGVTIATNIIPWQTDAEILFQ